MGGSRETPREELAVDECVLRTCRQCVAERKMSICLLLSRLCVTAAHAYQVDTSSACYLCTVLCKSNDVEGST